jgi:hypothetical protein
MEAGSILLPITKLDEYGKSMGNPEVGVVFTPVMGFLSAWTKLRDG